MTAIDFEETNVKLGANQEQYEALPAYFNDKEKSMTFCFQLNKEEIDEIQRTGKVWFKQLTFGRPLQPVAMSTQKEDVIY